MKLSELRPGEHLLGDDGPVPILETDLLHQSVPVYNLEIHGEHVYQIAETGILVHNAPCPNDLVTTIKSIDGEVIDVNKTFDDLAKQFTHNADSNIVVLGKQTNGIDDYARYAKDNGRLVYFSTPKEVYDQLRSQFPDKVDRFRINIAFIRQQIEAGKDILLVHKPGGATGTYAMELAELRKAGFQFDDDVAIQFARLLS